MIVSAVDLIKNLTNYTILFFQSFVNFVLIAPLIILVHHLHLVSVFYLLMDPKTAQYKNSVVLIFTMLFSIFAINSSATTVEEENTIMPRFSTIDAVSTSFTISGLNSTSAVILSAKYSTSLYIKVELQRSRIDRAYEALRLEDYNEFGSLLTAETADMIKAGRLSAVANLYDVITKRVESIGCGIVDDGALFAVVENKDVDFFVENVSREYCRYYGASPKFYITDTETSGKVY